MKQKTSLIVAVVLLLTAMIPVLAAAQRAETERTGSAVLRMGEQPMPASDGIAKSTEVPNGVKSAPNGILPPTGAEKLGIDPQGPPSAKVLFKMTESFEGAWPAGAWSTFDNNGSTGGYVCWNDEDWISKKGYWSGWPAAGCANGVDASYSYYPSNMDSWAVFGPFSTSGAKKADLKFNYWNNSEFGWDYFWWCASTDSYNWYCNYHTGTTNYKWKVGKLNLKAVPGYGSMLGRSNVYIAFVFQSDSSIEYDGPFIDQVALTVKK